MFTCLKVLDKQNGLIYTKGTKEKIKKGGATMATYRKADVGENYSYYLFTEPTKAGERLEVEITKVEARSKTASPWWNVKTYATDEHLNTYGRYNPQLDGFTINPAWKLDATEENKELILNEIERRAYR